MTNRAAPRPRSRFARAAGLLLGLISAQAAWSAASCTLAKQGAGSCSEPQTSLQLKFEAPASQVLQWCFDGGSYAYNLELFGPDGQLLRNWPAVNNGVQEFGWITTRPGNYRLAASLAHFAPDTANPVNWRLVAHHAYLPDTRAASAAQLPSSPQLLSLQNTLVQAEAPQRAKLLRDFWHTLAVRGAPLVEGDPDRPSEVLVTFLWRAPKGPASASHNVQIDWPMRSADSEQFVQLLDSDLWYLSVHLPRGLKMAYQIVADPPHWPEADVTPTRFQRAALQQTVSRRDTLNPHYWHADSPQLDPGGIAAQYAFRSTLDLEVTSPDTCKALHSTPLRGTAASSLSHMRFSSASLANTRSLSLYQPADELRRTPLPLLVLFDREAYLERVRIHERLDRWIAERRIPPIAMLLVSNPTRADRARELPPLSPAFANMLATELLPQMRRQYPAISNSASDVIVAGSSYGGLASGYAGWSHPETFGKVLSLSGSYWWQPTAGIKPSRWSESDWFMREVTEHATRPVRWHLGYGNLERGVGGESGIVDNNRHLRNVLRAKGYRVTTHEYAGGHDYYAWGDELLIGLQQLLCGEDAAGTND